jgi:uncharacterized protein (DUF2236 family)
MAIHGNERLYQEFKEEMQIVARVHEAISEQFKATMKLSEKEWEAFVNYWNERVDKENAESEANNG